MKILHIITGLSSGGAQTMLYKLLSGSDRDRFRSVVVSLTNCGALSKPIEALGVPVHCLGMARGVPSPAALGRLLQVVEKVRPDLLQGWMYHGNLAASLAAWKGPVGAPVVWNIRHSLYDLRKEKRLTALVIRAGAWLSDKPVRILYNAHVSAAQHESLGYKPEKTKVIPNGFDCERFVPSREAREKLRAELGVPSDALLIGLVARYHPMKDHATFLRAAACLVTRRKHVQFVLVGRGVDAHNGELRSMLTELGLASYVHLLGERRDISVLTAGLDIATTSSSWGEGFPNVIGEAMACAVPCAVTDVGDSSWIVGDTGKTVPPSDPEALAEAWRELIDISPEARRQLGLGARRRIEQHFSLPAIVARDQDLYAEHT